MNDTLATSLRRLRLSGMAQSLDVRLRVFLQPPVDQPTDRQRLTGDGHVDHKQRGFPVW